MAAVAATTASTMLFTRFYCVWVSFEKKASRISMAGKLLHQRSYRSLTLRFALSSCLSHFISFANIVNFTWNVFHIIGADIVCIRENGIVIEKDQQTLPPDFDFIFSFASMKVCKEDMKKTTIKKRHHFANWRMHRYWFDDKIIDFEVYWVRNGLISYIESL